MQSNEQQRYVRRAYEAVRQAEEARRDRFAHLQDPAYIVARRGSLTGSRVA